MLKRAVVKRNFMDSGAFSLYKRSLKYAKETGKGRWSYYDTKEFYKYLDDYAAFIKKNIEGIDLYVTVDAILNPELTLRNQDYLESIHGLKPVPVVHFGSDMSWLDLYIKRGHKLIGVGLDGAMRRLHPANKRWLDAVFNHVCDNPERLPCVKLHGFGFTSYQLIIRYPWASVDSSVWTQAAGYGNIYIPHLSAKSQYDFSRTPYSIKVTETCKARAKHGQHILTLKKAETKVLMGWLDDIGVPFGNSKCEGVSNSANMRRKANLLFFMRMARAQPKWPWPFAEKVHHNGFGFNLGRMR